MLDAGTLTSLVSSVGFPILCCGVMAYYVKYITDKNHEQIETIEEKHHVEVNSIQTQHKSEMEKVTEAINNNTIALNTLVNQNEIFNKTISLLMGEEKNGI